MSEFRIRPAAAGDLDAVRALIVRCALTLDGLADQFGPAYTVAETGGGIVGVAGMETHGTAGLLRSVAVAQEFQGRGLGRILTEDRLRWARENGLAPVYLLTTTAAPYFEKLGFRHIQRDAVPPELRASAEFAHACPLSAAVMLWLPR